MKRSNATESLLKNTPGLALVGEDGSGSALSPFGPRRAGLTTTQRTQNHQLTELLNSLESRIADLNSRYCAAYVILMDAMDLLVKLSRSIKSTDIIDNTKERE